MIFRTNSSLNICDIVRSKYYTRRNELLTITFESNCSKLKDSY